MSKLEPGQPIVLVDAKQRSTYATLRAAGSLNVRGDHVACDVVVGRPEGCRVKSRKGRDFHVFRATLAEHVLHMQRHATIIYPKDLATLLLYADLRPGLTVVEGGLGSGALSVAILQAIGPTGRLITYELQAAAIARSRKNIAALLGATPHHEIRQLNIYDGVDLPAIDRLLLDVPEPWEVVPTAAEILKDGGIFAAYVPTAVQMQRVVVSLRRGSTFPLVRCLETLERDWHVTPGSVRPEQHMIGHTGFLIFARKGERYFVPEDEDEAQEGPGGELPAHDPGAGG